MRHRPFGMAGLRQGLPFRVLACARQAKSRLEAEYDRADAEYEAFINELPNDRAR
jgi:hypothetical protein